jgi:ribosome-associated translation inhibitor RaiA
MRDQTRREGDVHRPDTPVVEVVALDPPARRFRAMAAAKVGGVVAQVAEPVLHVTVKLSVAHDRAVERSASADAIVDVNGDPVRAHAAAPTVGEAVDLLVDRLSAQLVQRSERRREHRRSGSSRP